MEVTVMPNPASVEKQQGLNQVVINKVQRMVEGKRQGVMETIARLLDEGKIAQDFIAPIGVNLRGKEKQPVISFRALDRVQMTMPEGNFSLHGNAISQISEKMGVRPSTCANCPVAMYGRNSFAPPSLMSIRAGPRAHGYLSGR